MSSQKTDQILKMLKKDYKLLEKVDNLVAITLTYNPKFRNYAGMAAQVLNLLAVKNINMLECLTTYSEFVLYISKTESERAIQTLQKLVL